MIHDLNNIKQCNFENKKEMNNLLFIVTTIKNEFLKLNYSSVDNFLFNSNIKEFDTSILVAIISSCFPAKEKLVNYKKFLEDVKSEFENRNIDYTILLKGL